VSSTSLRTRTLKDLQGKTLGGSPTDAALRLFPALCKIAMVECSNINITSIQPNLREQMLMQGRVDGVFRYVNTIRFSAKLVRRGRQADPLHQLRQLRDGPLFQCSDSVEAPRKGEAAGGEGARAGHRWPSASR
jgi:hypothetical protein